MPEIHPKSQEEIQAQVATFAAEHVEDFKDSGYIFDNIGTLAVQGAGDISRTLTTAEYHKDEPGNRSVRVPEGMERVVATANEYTDFLRSVGGTRYEAIQTRTEILKAYGRFEPKVTQLRAELADPATRKQHPNFLGNGSNSMVFALDDGDKKYAVRVPNGHGISPHAIDSHLGGAVLGKGMAHMEQIVAASYTDGVTVAEVMPGKEIGSLSAETIAKISDGQLSDLVDTIIEANKRGIEIDPKPSNFFYDADAGYGIVDYHSSRNASKNSADQGLGQVVGWMATVIDNEGFYGNRSYGDKSADDYVHDLEITKANYNVLNRFRSVVNSKLTGEELQEALEQIDGKLETEQRTIQNYSNSPWIAERIAEDAERKRRYEEQRKKPARDEEPAGWDFV